eukprot:jgi/Bigna1/84840/estExt_fgenesh1_pg.C_10188
MLKPAKPPKAERSTSDSGAGTWTFNSKNLFRSISLPDMSRVKLNISKMKRMMVPKPRVALPPLTPNQLKLKKVIESEKENQACADCRIWGRKPEWASLTYAVFICAKCAGRHRSLGVRFSFVQSVRLDHWTEDQVTRLSIGGNKRVKEFLKTQNLDPRVEKEIQKKYLSSALQRYRSTLNSLCEAAGGEVEGLTWGCSNGSAAGIVVLDDDCDDEKAAQQSNDGGSEGDDHGRGNGCGQEEGIFLTDAKTGDKKSAKELNAQLDTFARRMTSSNEISNQDPLPPCSSSGFDHGSGLLSRSGSKVGMRRRRKARRRSSVLSDPEDIQYIGRTNMMATTMQPSDPTARQTTQSSSSSPSSPIAVVAASSSSDVASSSAIEVGNKEGKKKDDDDAKRSSGSCHNINNRKEELKGDEAERKMRWRATNGPALCILTSSSSSKKERTLWTKMQKLLELPSKYWHIQIDEAFPENKQIRTKLIQISTRLAFPQLFILEEGHFWFLGEYEEMLEYAGKGELDQMLQACLVRNENSCEPDKKKNQQSVDTSSCSKPAVVVCEETASKPAVKEGVGIAINATESTISLQHEEEEDWKAEFSSAE